MNPLRNPFTGGRQSIEQPGLGETPQALERDPRARLTIQLADYHLFSEGPLGQRFEFMRINVPAVVARFGVARFVSARGWWLWEFTVQGGTVATTLIVAPTATALNASGTAARAGIAPIGDLTITTGDAAAAIGAGWFMPVAATFRPFHPVWIPPEFPIELGGVVANTQMDLTLIASSPTIAAA